MPGMLEEQSSPELVRILAREEGKFVNETLDGKAGVGVSHRAPPLNRNVDLSLVIFDRQIRNRVREIVGAFDGRGVVAFFVHHALKLCSREYRLTHKAGSPT